MKRVAVIGPGGARKSTFARALGAKTGLDVFLCSRGVSQDQVGTIMTIDGDEPLARAALDNCNRAEPVVLVYVGMDQRGLPRLALASAQCDIGSVEIQPSTPTVPPERKPQPPRTVLVKARFTG